MRHRHLHRPPVRGGRASQPQARGLRRPGQRPQGRIRLPPPSLVRDRRKGGRLLSAGRGFPQHQQRRCRLSPARIRHLRRTGRQPYPGAAPRAADAGGDHHPHDSAGARSQRAGGDGRAGGTLRPPRRHERVRGHHAPGHLRGLAGADRPHPPRNSRCCVHRSELLQGPVRRGGPQRPADFRPARSRQGPPRSSIGTPIPSTSSSVRPIRP